MATRQIKVVISVQDGATKKMRQVERATRRTGKAADEASKRFMHFNRTLFTTTAFVGTFLAAFRSMGNVINQGADFTRLQNAFQGIFGKNADVIKMIKSFTDTSVDEMDAMRASIRLSSKDLGLGQAEVGELLARGSVAAKKAGMTAAEGAKAIAEAIRTGNIEAADNLNIINKGGVAYKAYEAAIAKASGTMSPAVKIMYRKRLILNALRESTEGYMRGNRDLKDVLVTANNALRRFTTSMGNFLGKALGPLIDGASKLATKMAAAINEMANNKKFVETAKYVTIATGAVIGLAGALGTLKLATLALGSFAAGFPGLIALLAAGTVMFAGLTSKADSLNEKFKVFTNFFKGIWQLVSNFKDGTGLSTMDKEVADLMVKFGLMTREIKDGKVVYDGFLVQVSRGVIVVKKFVTGLAAGIKTAFDSVMSVFNSISDKIKEILNLKSGPWARGWLDSAENLGKSFGVLASVVGGLLALKGIKSSIGNLITSFGGKGRDRGSITNPMYTVDVGSRSLVGGKSVVFKDLEWFKRFPGKLKGIFTGLLSFLGKWNPFSKGNLAVLLSRMGRFGTIVATAIGGLSKVIGVLLTPLKFLGGALVRTAAGLLTLPGLIAGAVGLAIGTYLGKKINTWLDKSTQGKTEEGFEGNAVERAMFWVDKKTGILGGHAQNFIDNQKKIDAMNKEEARREKLRKEAPNIAIMDDYRKQREESDKKEGIGKPSQVTNPRVFKDELSKVDEMAMEMSELTGQKRMQAQKSMEAALAADSEGGASITQKEMSQFKAILEALNSSEMTKNTKVIAEKLDGTQAPISRRVK